MDCHSHYRAFAMTGYVLGCLQPVIANVSEAIQFLSVWLHTFMYWIATASPRNEVCVHISIHINI